MRRIHDPKRILIHFRAVPGKTASGGVERKSIKIRWVGGVSWNINVLYGGILPIIIVLVGVNNKFKLFCWGYSLLIITTLSVKLT